MFEKKTGPLPVHKVRFPFVRVNGGKRDKMAEESSIYLFGDDGYIYGVSGDSADQLLRLGVVEINKVMFTAIPCKDGSVVLESDIGLIKAVALKNSVLRVACA